VVVVFFNLTYMVSPLKGSPFLKSNGDAVVELVFMFLKK
jgi:hypothetical protein